ncbi:carboxymuconolactone decarboxylase family protein [Dactylosporangium sp. NPDC049525]|uniref:carboxymuconolactone decarboxylase family protein n=1 Tax=Dactylosporangium sp. NPDC049525 TaxID=3154730 RepID=UPI003418E10E
MTALLTTRATRRAALAHVRYVTPTDPTNATGLVKQVYRQVERDFGMLAPPIALHSPAPDVLAAAWIMLRETLLASGTVTRVTKEAVAAAVSAANACPYCVDIHGATLTGLGGLSGPDGRHDAAAIAADRIDDVGDPQLRSIVRWARSPVLDAAVPFPAAQLPELGGVAVVFHYINRMVSVFLQRSPLPPLPGPARRTALWMAGRVMSSIAQHSLSPSTALELLPRTSVPPDIAWAGPTRIAEALARASAAIESAAASVVPERIRDIAQSRLSEWDGTPPGLSASWVDTVLAGVPDDELAPGRLVLLTAQSAYQVGDAVIADFRRFDPLDTSLVAAASWAAITAARSIGARLPTGRSSA